MKQCPVCNEVFDPQKAFCDMDGSPLVDPDLVNSNKTSSAWITGAIGGFIGVILCIFLYIGFLAPSQKDAQQQPPTQTAETVKTNHVAKAPSNSQLPADETATPEEEASPEPSPSPEETAAAAPASTPAPATLNNGPIATGGKSIGTGERAIIKMKDGSSVEADAAWEDAQGVWFRRSGLVSFVEKSRVEAITEPPQKRADTKSP